MKYESNWFGSSLETEEPVWIFETRQPFNLSAEAQQGLKFNAEASFTVERDYVAHAGRAGEPRFLVRVGYRASTYYLLHAAWFLIVTALMRTVHRG